MWRTFSRLFEPTFWLGVIVGAILGGSLVWRFDMRAVPSADLKDARHAVQIRKWEVASGILNRYLQRFPDDPEAKILLGQAMAARGNFAECIERLRSVSADSDWSAEARLREAQAQF